LGCAARAARELGEADDLVLRRGGHRADQPTLATHSISTRTPRGSAATATVERAGRDPPMCLAYTSFTFAKSAMSTRKIVVFATSAQLQPAFAMTAVRFFMTCSACAVTSPSITCPVFGSSAI